MSEREECDDDDELLDDEESGDCFHCGGDGYVECPDPIECTRRHVAVGDTLYRACGSCGGSGRAKDMTIW